LTNDVLWEFSAHINAVAEHIPADPWGFGANPTNEANVFFSKS
jgi:hypothetical protein